MSQIMYNYPAMLAHSGDMSGFAGTMPGLGADISSEQAALSNAWQGDTGMTYQAGRRSGTRRWNSWCGPTRRWPAPTNPTRCRCWLATPPKPPSGAASDQIYR